MQTTLLKAMKRFPSSKELWSFLLFLQPYSSKESIECLNVAANQGSYYTKEILEIIKTDYSKSSK
jgi:hypothetical protein